MKRSGVLSVIDVIRDADLLFEHLMEEARRTKREQFAEEFRMHRHWFIKTVAQYQKEKKVASI